MRCAPSPSAEAAASPAGVSAMTAGSHAGSASSGRWLDQPTSLALFLGALARWLEDAEVTEICINRPGEAFVERQSGWQREEADFLTFDWCLSVARLVANFTRQRISSQEPLLSATLPGGERIQIVLPPATAPGTVSLTIRRPSRSVWSLEQLHERGMFDHVRPQATLAHKGQEDRRGSDGAAPVPDPGRAALRALLAQGETVAFLREAVRQRQNILLSGATGSGKTTVSKALILEVPADDRLITIEDVQELSLRNQPNHVRLFYSQGGQGQSEVTPGQLLAGAKRQRPDRIFVSELRTGDEVYDYLVSVNTGHPGSITSVHADSARMAFVALAQLMKRSDAGRGMTTREGVELARLSIDVVVQCARERQHRFVREIWLAPEDRGDGLR